MSEPITPTKTVRAVIPSPTGFLPSVDPISIAIAEQSNQKRGNFDLPYNMLFLHLICNASPSQFVPGGSQEVEEGSFRTQVKEGQAELMECNDHNLLYLARIKSSLEELGDKAATVHPLPECERSPSVHLEVLIHAAGFQRGEYIFSVNPAGYAFSPMYLAHIDPAVPESHGKCQVKFVLACDPWWNRDGGLGFWEYFEITISGVKVSKLGKLDVDADTSPVQEINSQTSHSSELPAKTSEAPTSRVSEVTITDDSMEKQESEQAVTEEGSSVTRSGARYK